MAEKNSASYWKGKIPHLPMAENVGGQESIQLVSGRTRVYIISVQTYHCP